MSSKSTPLFLALITLELAIVMWLVAGWLPEKVASMSDTSTTPVSAAPGADAPDADSYTTLLNRLNKIDFAIKKMAKSRRGPKAKDWAALKKNSDRSLQILEEMSTEVYEFERDTFRNLNQLQKNIMRRLSKLAPSGAHVIPKDEAGLQRLLKDGKVTLDRDNKEVRIACKLAAPYRPLELVASTPGGSVHESLLEVDCRPNALRIALLSLGLVCGAPADAARNRAPSGDLVDIFVTWKDLKEPIPLGDLIADNRDQSGESSLSAAKWIFCGNGFDTNFLTGDDIYTPDESRVLIGLTDNFSHLCVLSCIAADTANETIWRTNIKLLPSDTKTPLTLIFRAHPK